MRLFNHTNNITLRQLKFVCSELQANKINVSPSLKSYPYQKSLWAKKLTPNYGKRLHNLTLIQYCLSYYEKFNDESLIEKALTYFYLWYEQNYPKSDSEYCYEVEVVCERLINVCDLLTVCKELDLMILDDVFINIIMSHINILVETREAIAIIIAAIVYNKYYIANSSTPYLNLGLKSLYSQLDSLLIEGQYMGKSGYQLFFQLSRLYDYLSTAVAEDITKYLKSKLDELYYFLYNLTVPGEIFPGYPYELSEEVEFQYSNVLFDKAKLFIYANCKTINQDYYKIIFKNGNHNYDNLSFTLYYRNYLMLTDRNTIMVDFHDYLLGQINSSIITNYLFTDELAYVSGFHLLYEDVLIRRSLICFYKQIYLIDEISSFEPHDYTLIFNFAAGLDLKLNENNCLIGKVDNQEIIRFEQLTSSIKMTPFLNKQQLTFRGKGQNEIVIAKINLTDNSKPDIIKVNKQEVLFTLANNEYKLIRSYYYRQLLCNNCEMSLNIPLDKTIERKLISLLITNNQL